MVKDSALFYYYSMHPLPENCYLNLNPDIAYRNMLMLPSDGKIHFEFPEFEDHSYNTICNRLRLKELIKRPSKNEKYIIFRTFSKKLKTPIIIGYYRVGKEFYYETNMWDNYGFVWGIESDEVHLLKKDDLIYEGPRIPRTPPVSWGEDAKWQTILNELLEEIASRQNIAELYQSETKRLVDIFKNPAKIKAWRERCGTCDKQCLFKKSSERYHKDNPTDLISVIRHAHTSNLYSQNELSKLKKIYLRR